jgi:hypothetical protein
MKPWRRRVAAGLLVAAAAAAVIVAAPAALARSLNGFSLDGASIPAEEIRRGGPPRDGIPALDHPEAVASERSPWPDAARVVGVALGGEARAYPIALLDWHELVNDRLGGLPVLVSWCPLCGTAMVFDRRLEGRVLSFGVSGLLYQSDLLMFDRETDSLWSQISAHAVTGPQRGERLALLRSRTTTWGQWKAAHPETTVLGRETGYARDYGRGPYVGYEQSERLYFPAPLDRRYHPKARVVGLRSADGRARVYPADELRAAGGSVRDAFAGHEVRIDIDGNGGFSVEAAESIEVIEGFWFAWMAFHPKSTVYRAPR